MKLNYTSKRTITTADLFDACNPPLIFEVRTRPPKGWAQIDLDFSESDHTDVELAKRLIAGVFLTVTDGSEHIYNLITIEQVEDLQQAIEQGNPGYGEDFLITIAWGFSVNYYNFIGNHLGNSLKPLMRSGVNGQGKSKVKES